MFGRLESEVQLGAGLIGIGRTWGHKETPIPPEEEALVFLQTAYDSGIRYFDTAPSYGTSEERLGKFLKSLSPEQRSGVVVATKFGEHWDTSKQSAYANHSFGSLQDSIDQSLNRLGRIDLLQVHKTTPDVLKSNDLNKAIEYAKKHGIPFFGASVSDVESGQMVCESDVFSAIQLPYNSNNTKFSDVINEALHGKKLVVVNRPFNMGSMLYALHEPGDEDKVRCEAYEFVVDKVPVGVILTGTKSPDHLRQNMTSFNRVKTKK